MELVSSNEAWQAAVNQMKAQHGYPPRKARVGIDYAKELFRLVSPQTKATEAEFLTAIEKGGVRFNEVELEAGWA